MGYTCIPITVGERTGCVFAFSYCCGMGDWLHCVHVFIQDCGVGTQVCDLPLVFHHFSTGTVREKCNFLLQFISDATDKDEASSDTQPEHVAWLPFKVTGNIIVHYPDTPDVTSFAPGHRLLPSQTWSVAHNMPIARKYPYVFLQKSPSFPQRDAMFSNV